MHLISEELVEETWQEFSGFSPEQGNEEVQKLGKEQPELLAFMMELIDDLTQDVKELALYIFVVVYRMFRKACGRQISGLSAEEIMEQYEKNEKLILSLEGAHDKFYDRIARVQLSEQPYVMKYVVEALIEMPEDDDPVELTDNDIGIIFLFLKTVIDLLNQATDK